MRYCYIPVIAKVIKLMWHGTSSINLRSILKQGLTVNTKNVKKNFSDYSSVAAIHKGVYVTSSLEMAYKDYAQLSARTHHCNPVLVLCSISMDQENVKLDEDYFTDFIPNLYMDLEALDIHKAKKLQFAYKSFSKLLCNTFPTVPKERFDNLLGSRELKRYLNKLVDLSSADEDSLGTVMLLDKKITSFITSEIGKLSPLIHETDSTVNFIGDAINYSITTPIKYKGSKKIVAIFEQVDDVDDEQHIFKQVYGDRKYKRHFIHDWVREVREPIVFEDSGSGSRVR